MENFVHESLRLLLILIVVDYLLGVFRAIYQRRFNSEVGVKGVIQKLAIILLLTASFIIKTYITNENLISMIAIQTLITGIIFTELASIRRNLKQLGLDPIVLRWLPEDQSHINSVEYSDKSTKTSKRKERDGDD